MKKIKALVVFLIVIIFGVVNGYALSPELKDIQDMISDELPVVMGEGYTFTKFKITDDNKMEMSFVVQELEGLSASDLDSESRNAFRQAFLEAIAGGDFLNSICKKYGLVLWIYVYNPQNELVIKEFFKASEL